MTTVTKPDAFHIAIIAAATKGMTANSTMIARMGELLVSKYGTTAPTFEQFRNDHAQLAALAKEKGLKDNQWVRKPFNIAVKNLYVELPESQSAASIAKRALRAKQPAKAGAPKAVVGTRAPSHAETVEQFIARVGVFKVLEVCTTILASDKTTKAQADALKFIKASTVQKAA